MRKTFDISPPPTSHPSAEIKHALERDDLNTARALLHSHADCREPLTGHIVELRTKTPHDDNGNPYPYGSTRPVFVDGENRGAPADPWWFRHWLICQNLTADERSRLGLTGGYEWPLRNEDLEKLLGFQPPA